MRRRYSKSHYQSEPQHNRNLRIRARELNVIGPDGSQIGILSRDEALKRAQDEGLDLVEIAPNATPPVAKIIDYNKFIYQQNKKRRENKKPTKKSGEAKEVWLTPFIAEHDLVSRAERGKELLQESGKLRIVVKFKRREMRKIQFGHDVIKKFIELSGSSDPDRPPQFLGNRLIATVSKK